MNTNKESTVITDEMVLAAMTAIESTEPTPEERQAGQLAKLIPVIHEAIKRGDSKDKICKRLKASGINLHHRRLRKLFDAATTWPTESNEQLQGGAK
ncbi:hypothetical protein RHOFW510R12_04020 [Rhodanobacter sp. FW510-R12]|uniref:hypothetical protein n=1 Tax=Rhodanobacter TaxID=75309 RepID=UPI00048567A1|nr:MULTISPECIES: hypothetical protein [Rhodanobacter]TAN14615.1 MAG: hypothetical protein EPN35_14955 [Rhodanobacter sp.]UJJ55225.1 hypothetical protein LRK53_02135 [Rhodanobacter thiooxydans]